MKSHKKLGMSASFDFRTAVPIPFIAYYPSILPQDKLEEKATILTGRDSNSWKVIDAGHPSKYEKNIKRNDTETRNPVALDSFGPTKTQALGMIAQGRSGDKASLLTRLFQIS